MAKSKILSSSPKGLKSVSQYQQKKIVIFSVVAFALVGAVILIRSFAATIVYKTNISDIISKPNPSWTIKNATITEVPDGKKTQKVVKVTAGGQLAYTYGLNPGAYKTCFNVKPTSADASGTISRDVVGKQSGKGGTFSVATGGIKLNKYQEICMSQQEPGSVDRYKVSINLDKGSWEVSTFEIRLDEDYASYGSYASPGKFISN